MSQIVTTKFRNVPWHEVAEHYPGAPSNAEQLWESQMRGKEIQVLTPPELVEDRLQYVIIRGGPENFSHVCSTCAELGD